MVTRARGRLSHAPAEFGQELAKTLAGDGVQRLDFGGDQELAARLACSTRFPRSGRGCSWPRAAWPPPGGRGRAASARTTSPAAPGRRNIWCWPGFCSPRTTRARRLRCWTGCTPRRPPRTGPAASSRSVPCKRWRWRPVVRTQRRWPPWLGALTSGCPQGYVRVFADEGPPMAALVGKLIVACRAGWAAEVPLGCLARLQLAFGATQSAPDPGPRTAAAPGIVEPLTARGLELLGMLAAGRSSQAIAGELVVTLDSVKCTSAACWTSSAQPTAPRPPTGRASWA